MGRVKAGWGTLGSWRVSQAWIGSAVSVLEFGVVSGMCGLRKRREEGITQ